MKRRAGQAIAYSSGFSAVHFLSCANPIGRGTFLHLNFQIASAYALAMRCALFKFICQKFDTRRMDKFNEA